MGKGSAPRKGHNAQKQRKNYDDIDWSKKPEVQKMDKPAKTSVPKQK